MDDVGETRFLALEQRMELWEARFDAGIASVESKIAQLRDEMQMEFSAILDAIEAGDEQVRRELTERFATGLESVRTELRKEIRDGDEETRRYMRVLHEDLVARIALLGETR